MADRKALLNGAKLFLSRTRSFINILFRYVLWLHKKLSIRTRFAVGTVLKPVRYIVNVETNLVNWIETNDLNDFFFFFWLLHYLDDDFRNARLKIIENNRCTGIRKIKLGKSNSGKINFRNNQNQEHEIGIYIPTSTTSTWWNQYFHELDIQIAESLQIMYIDENLYYEYLIHKTAFCSRNEQHFHELDARICNLSGLWNLTKSYSYRRIQCIIWKEKKSLGGLLFFEHL